MSQMQVGGKFYACKCLIKSNRLRNTRSRINLNLNFQSNSFSNTNFSNQSTKMRISQRLRLSGSSQQTNPVAIFNTGKIYFGNFYLNQPLKVNYLGQMEGQPGGTSNPPRNKYI